jgi:hypothetical protein
MTKKGVAILIGCSQQDDATLPSLPQAGINVLRLRKYLRDQQAFAGVRDLDIITIKDPSSQVDITKHLEEVKEFVDDSYEFLLFYYCGHGLRVNKKLYLALKNTDVRWADDTAFAQGKINKFLQDFPISQIKNKLIIYDCCYSGTAVEAEENSGAGLVRMGFVSETPSRLSISDIDVGETNGTVVWAASGSNSEALANNINFTTVFTDEFLSVLENGVDNAGRILTIGEVFEATKANITNNGKLYRSQGIMLPEPTCFPEDPSSSGNGLRLVANRRLEAAVRILERLRVMKGGAFAVTSDNVDEMAEEIVDLIDGNGETRVALDAASVERLYAGNTSLGITLLKLVRPDDLDLTKIADGASDADVASIMNKVDVQIEYMNSLAIQIHGYSFPRPSKNIRQFSDIDVRRYIPWIDKRFLPMFITDQQRIMRAALESAEVSAKVPLVFGGNHPNFDMRGRTFFPVMLSTTQLKDDDRKKRYLLLIALVSGSLVEGLARVKLNLNPTDYT